MTGYRVVVLARAARDVQAILTWLKKRSELGAQRWKVALDLAKLRLSEDPLRFPLIPEKLRLRFEVRDVLFKTRKGKFFRAIFTIVGDEVRILRIRRPAQRPIRGRDLPRP
jgi:plasmid stabilization system protein ParE